MFWLVSSNRQLVVFLIRVWLCFQPITDPYVPNFKDSCHSRRNWIFNLGFLETGTCPVLENCHPTNKTEKFRTAEFEQGKISEILTKSLPDWTKFQPGIPIIPNIICSNTVFQPNIYKKMRKWLSLTLYCPMWNAGLISISPNILSDSSGIDTSTI